MEALVVHFGGPRYLRFVREMRDDWERVGARVPLSILTDTETEIPDDIGLPVIRVRVLSEKHSLRKPGWLIRHGHAGAAFDRKAAIICTFLTQAATDGTARPVWLLDSDNKVHSDPTQMFERIAAEGKFTIVPDPGKRSIFHPQFVGTVLEESSSCMFFPASAFERLVADFLNLWETSCEPDHFLLEQRTWTLVAARQGMVAPRLLSWSHCWGHPAEDCILEHRHGDRKWST